MPAATDERPPASQVRADLLEAGDKLRELRATKPEDRADSWEDDTRDAIRTINHLDAILVAYERGDEPPEQPKGPKAAMARTSDDGYEFRSPGELYTTHEHYTNHGHYHGGNLPDIPANNLIDFRHAGPDAEVRTLLTTAQTDPAAGLWMPRGTPIPPTPRQLRLFIRDVLAVVPTTLNSVPYIRELNPVTNETGASSVAEGGLKPEVTMQFVGADAPIRKIAAWIPVTSEVVDDAPTLRGYIDARLGYMLALREEQEILNGNGVAPDLTGIRHTVGLQTQSTAGAGEAASTIGLAIGKIELVDGDPDFLAMNPADFWLMLTTRHANQLDYSFSGNLPYGSPPTSVFGLTPIRTRAMESTKFLVGSGRLGATIFDRQQTVIRVGNQHDDWMIYNKLLILAEERLGLAVHRPDFFCEGTVSWS
jgi:HK97 family phage major capsid protein